jgi:hypothetical protein
MTDILNCRFIVRKSLHVSIKGVRSDGTYARTYHANYDLRALETYN